MRDEYELRLQSASATLSELQSQQQSSAAPQADAVAVASWPESPECESRSSCIRNSDGSLSLFQSMRNSLASVRSVPTTEPEKAMLELRTENERLQALIEYLRLQNASSNTLPALAVRILFSCFSSPPHVHVFLYSFSYCKIVFFGKYS